MTANFFSIVIVLCLLLVRSCVNSTCQCINYTMVCENGDLPKHVPLEIRELFIQRFNLDNVSKIQLQNVSAIRTLDIQADEGENIFAKSFELFTNLTHLGIHGKDLLRIDKDAFLGLQNLLTLNLSSNPILYVPMITRALNSDDRVVLPKLVSLSIAKVKTSKGEAVKLDKDFYKSIGSIGRQLKHLDLSGLNLFKFDFTHIEPICKTVEFLDLRRSVIASAENFVNANACTSLKTTDFSESIFPALRHKFSFETFHFYCETLNFFSYLENLFADKVNAVHEFKLNGYFLDMSTCPLKFRKISISGNRIKWLNMTVRLHETTKISQLNMSYNGMEYISPSVLHPSESIEILDFSNNKLGVMEENYRSEFEVLFWKQKKLLYLDLSSNSLNEIPKETFINNGLLNVLDISFNNIKVIDFSIAKLVNIETLIATYNAIQMIEENAREEIQLLSNKTSSNITNGDILRTPLQVYLKGNPFTCTCDKTSMEFIYWLYSAAVIADSEAITCKLDGADVNIRDNARKETKHFCTMQIVEKAAMISTPFVLTIIVLSTVTVVIIKKQRKKKRHILSIISHIENGSFPQSYLAFLSYCSEDMDLVSEKIYPQLCKNLSKTTHSNKQLVCCGDRLFRPGFALRYELMRCVDQSSVFIAVISRNFCRKSWCNLEIGWAFDQNKPIIMLMVEHVEKELMDEFLQKIFDRYAHATWVSDNNGGHIEPNWKIFCTSIIQLAGKPSTEEMRIEREGLM